MKVFFAEHGNKYFLQRMQEEGFGLMYSDRPVKEGLYGFDNGAYSAYTQGKPFPETKFLKRIDHAITVSTPYMAVCPDIVMGGMESLDFSLEWIDKLPEWPWYLAVQDGMTPEDVRPHLNKFFGIFIGGSNPFKDTIPLWQSLGVPVHYGRCGTRRKVARALQLGVDSIDSSTPLQHGVQYFEQICGCIKYGDPQAALFT